MTFDSTQEEHLFHWFQRSMYSAQLAGKRESAALWKEGLDYIKAQKAWYESREKHCTQALTLIQCLSKPGNAIERIASEALKRVKPVTEKGEQ